MSKIYARDFYNSMAWINTRKAYFNYRNKKCERCGGIGAIVHHKKYLTPKNINDINITLNFDNLELLCRECHEKQHRPRDNHAEDVMFVNGKLVKKPKEHE